jgi:hypothetical protein
VGRLLNSRQKTAGDSKSISGCFIKKRFSYLPPRAM